MIRIEGLRFGYRGDAFLRVDAFELPARGEVLVTGPSGCGKTTLLYLLAGILLPQAGSIVVDGVDIAKLAPAARDRFRGRHIGVVFQQFHLLPALTILQNLTVAQSMAQVAVDRSAARDVLAALGVADLADAYPPALSVGQQQRAAIARALVNRPPLILADEPTSNLDDEACAGVADLLLEASRRAGAALVIATHDGRLKARIAGTLELPRRAARPA